MDADRRSLIACPQCDLLLREVPLPPGGSARCRRCGAVLYRNSPDSLARTLACTTAGLILFIIANIHPILGIDVRGARSATNLFGAVHSLWQQKMHLIALLVAATTIVVPALELSLLTYILVFLRMGRVPTGFAAFLRLLRQIEPWGMVEVFMLGVLVSLVKLAGSATIVPGVALWCFGGLTLLMAAASAGFDHRDVWGRLAVIRLEAGR